MNMGARKTTRSMVFTIDSSGSPTAGLGSWVVSDLLWGGSIARQARSPFPPARQGHSGESGLVRTIVARLRQNPGDNADQPLYIFTDSRVAYRMGKKEMTENGDHRTVGMERP